MERPWISEQLNALHAFLIAGNVQAQPVVGTVMTINGATYPCIVSQVDERITMEMEGYLSDADWIAVVSRGDMGSLPVENTQVTIPDNSGGTDTYLTRGVKSDLSSYTFALKKYTS